MTSIIHLIHLIQSSLGLASTRQSMASAYFTISPVGTPSKNNKRDEWYHRC